jgi:isopentenyl diphosphate isomerase/L-lactate dehydrogenase-like FMN-dependent dehydrogenase
MDARTVAWPPVRLCVADSLRSDQAVFRGMVGPFEYRWRAPETLISVEDYRRAAARRVPRVVWDYIEGGADDLVTVRRNRGSFSRWSLRARMMTAYPERRLSTTVAGVDLALPVLLAPTGALGLSHWSGDLAAARAAEAAGTRLVLSTASSWSIEEVAAGTNADHFFQLYPGGDETATLMQRAWACGYRALFVTVDVPVLGNREGERRFGYTRSGTIGRTLTLTPREALDMARHPRWVADLYRHGRGSMRNLLAESGVGATFQSIEILHREIDRATFAWDDLEWIREHWPGTVYVKGVLDPEDAVRAVTLGCEGVVVSNHGGRQLDHSLSALDALPPVVAAVGDRAEVLLDGGIRRGTDIVKALALGARAVLIGRPQIYGLIVGRERGVVDVLGIFRAELDRALALMGVQSVHELDRSWVIPVADPSWDEEPARGY